MFFDKKYTLWYQIFATSQPAYASVFTLNFLNLLSCLGKNSFLKVLSFVWVYEQE